MALWSRRPTGNGSTPEPPAAPASAATPGLARAALAVPQPTVPTTTASSLKPGAASSASDDRPAANAEQAQRRAAASRRRLLALGQIVSILTRNAQYRAMPLAELETMVLPALVSGQFLVVEAHSKENGIVVPVAMALWAVVSPEVDARLSANLEQNVRLAANEWKSGDIPWLMAAAGDQSALRPALQKLQDSAHNGRAFKLRIKEADGSLRIGTIDRLQTSTGASDKPSAQQN